MASLFLRMPAACGSGIVQPFLDTHTEEQTEDGMSEFALKTW